MHLIHANYTYTYELKKYDIPKGNSKRKTEGLLLEQCRFSIVYFAMTFVRLPRLKLSVSFSNLQNDVQIF